MASIETEYARFLEYLNEQNDFGENIRRLANLVRSNLRDLAEVGAARRARSTRLVPIALQQFEATSPDLVPQGVLAQNQADQPHLDKLEVGPFRGFMSPETFDLSHDITLVYGANGTGKSSFCEALETAMLGYISEAQAKRVEHRDYCNNVRLRRHAAPVLTTRAVDGSAGQLAVNESLHRFCFIEKNRLDDFARIAARTPADQRQLIATLFGIDQFSEFVRGFNQSLDESLQLVGPKATQLKLAREKLAASEQTVNSYAERIEAHRRDQAALAETILAGQNYEAACKWLLGTDDEPGRLPTIQAQLDAPSPTIQGFTADRLTQLLSAREHAMQQWSDASRMLAVRAGEVSYAQLYEAVLALAEGADSCPACGTDLTHVRNNPFDRARAGLQELADLAVLQQQEVAGQQALSEATRALWLQMVDVMAALRAACKPNSARCSCLLFRVRTPVSGWANGQRESNRHGITCYASSAWSNNRMPLLGAPGMSREQLVIERNRLDGHRLAVERLRTTAEALQKEYGEAQLTITQFEEANRELIAAVESEKDIIALNQRIKAAYDEYLPVLHGYLGTLPAQLIQGLAEQAKDLYNAFNRGDHGNDKLNGLWLPIAENGKIEIEFVGSLGVRYDALVVLSEGHIRCLGLAILLAKNIEQHCPVVIFDDVVNAIDDEHRDGIWRTFFEDGRLDGKQVILTSHAEEFLLRIQQELGAVRAGEIRRYKFLPHAGEHELRVDADPPIKNYVLLAQQALNADEKRDGLRHTRPAIESLTDQLWTWMGRRGDGRLELKLPGPRSPWELNNKCLKLRSALNRMSAQYPNVVAAVAALDKLLSVNGVSIEWGYLNSGTHDSRREQEFDRAAVRTIVEAVVALDQAAVALRNG
ncbi:AAA family ATPase [Rhodanobacter lindaniclasticus]